MRLPDLDPTGGAIELRDVLIEYDGPQLVTAKNAAGAIYLGIHGPVEGEYDTWLFVRTDQRRLSELRRGRIPLRNLIVDFAKGPVALCYYHDETPERFEFVLSKDLEERFLPKPESYLPVAPEVAEEMSTAIALEEVVRAASRSDYSSALSQVWELAPSTVSFLTSHKTPLNIVARRRGRTVADIIFDRGSHETHFPVPELAKILLNTQRAVDSLAADESTSTPTGRPTAALKRQTRLDAVAVLPSSFSIRVETHEGTLFGDTSAEAAFRRLVALFNAIESPEAFESLFRSQRPETRLYIGQVVRDLARNRSSVTVLTGFVSSADVERASAPAEAVEEISRRLGDLKEEPGRKVLFYGRLKAVSLRSRFFLMENEEESVSGQIAKELLPSISGKEIDALYQATLQERLVLHELSGEIERKLTLVGLTSSSDEGDHNE
jgi:hypothetical protein